MKRIYMEDQEADYWGTTPEQFNLMRKRAKQVKFKYNYKSKEDDRNHCNKRK